MMQLIGALPTIFSAIGKFSELFDKGKAAVNEVSGEVSKASTPEELHSEVSGMSADKQNRWAEIMAREVDLYARQNERLAIEIGLIDENITEKLTPEIANEVARLRMTTRPWAVRLMVHYVLFPFYLVIIDLVQHLLITWFPFIHSWFGIVPFNAFEYVFGVMQLPDDADANTIQKLIDLFKESNGATTFAGQLYSESIPWVVSIILGYMGLREYGKTRDANRPGNPDVPVGTSRSPMSVVTKTLSGGTSLVGKIVSWFKR